MTPTEALSDAAASDGPTPFVEYRAPSALAMLALALGLLSGISVFAPILGIFALVAIAVGVYALRHIAVNSDQLSGRWMAITPLLLAPLFLGWGFSREFSRRERFVSHAREFTDDWLSILNRNEPYFAHQFTVSKQQRLDPHTNLEVAYQGNETGADEFKRFRENSPTMDILAAAPNVQFQYEEYGRFKHVGLTDSVTLQFTCVTQAAGPTRFWVTVKREFSNYSGQADWRILEISLTRPRGF